MDAPSAPAALGRTLGAALLRHMLAEASAAGYAVARLLVNVDNPARALYHRLGFAPRRVERYRPLR